MLDEKLILEPKTGKSWFVLQGKKISNRDRFQSFHQLSNFDFGNILAIRLDFKFHIQPFDQVRLQMNATSLIFDTHMTLKF